ncbi:tetratricopeptide repeat protein [Pseudothermotoga sp.]|uniref:tetratricopeptide repeat protein n=1 Tax=Pseudothermotoga sp. TaxID=2033661 RepID=UPI0031F63965
MERVIDLIIGEKSVQITTDTPFVVIVRDLFYDGDWHTMRQDLKDKKDVIEEIEKCLCIEESVVLLNETVYEPVCFDELKDWLEEKKIFPKDFVHASLAGLYDLALDYADKDLHEEAFKVIRYMLEVDKNYAPAYELYGSLLIEKGEIEQGIRYLDKAIEIDPWLVPAYSSLGEAYYNSGDYLRAVSYWEREIEYAPDNKLTYFMLADVYRKLKAYDKVYDVLERLLKRDPESIMTMYQLSQAYKDAGKIEEAQRMEEKILASRPTRMEDIEPWARMQLKRGNYKLVQEFLSLLPNSEKVKPYAKLLLALCELKQGNQERAKQAFAEVKDQSPWYLYGNKEFFSELLTEEEMRACGIS